MCYLFVFFRNWSGWTRVFLYCLAVKFSIACSRKSICKKNKNWIELFLVNGYMCSVFLFFYMHIFCAVELVWHLGNVWFFWSRYHLNIWISSLLWLFRVIWSRWFFLCLLFYLCIYRFLALSCFNYAAQRDRHHFNTQSGVLWHQLCLRTPRHRVASGVCWSYRFAFCQSGHAAVYVCRPGFYSGCVALGVAFDPGWIYDSVARVLCVSELVRSWSARHRHYPHQAFLFSGAMV